VRDGIRLVWSLREGNMSILFELFPHLEKQFNPDATELLAEFRAMMLHSRVVDAPPQPALTAGKGSTLGQGRTMELPTFDDDDAPTIVLNRSTTATSNGAAFLASFANLMD
jgi:hypothetical protein